MNTGEIEGIDSLAILLSFYNKTLKRNLTEVPHRTVMNKMEVWEFVEETLTRLQGRF